MTTTKIDNDIDPKAFRRALGNFATGVTIITATAPDGTKVGVTASSFNSLSMDPPLILWSSMKDTRSCEIFENASHFAVNILASDQMDMSNHFARQQKDKFAGIEWEEGIGGAPVFPNCAGRFQCESYDKLDGGDHWIFVGKVVAFDDFGRSPLCFHQGSYAVVFNHPETFAKAEDHAVETPANDRMGNHTFFLMLRAVRAYQQRYQPKLETLGLSLIEARILLVLADVSGLPVEKLVMNLHTPTEEANAALVNLSDRGLVEKSGDDYALTAAGQDKAGQCWALADNHAEETFKGLDDDQIGNFTEVLHQLIAK
ncbi:flavin reductase [Octadecabacter sp. 1_MG-2023]|uniref:p-hydroxyphenylacetate 3-hydroxylase reductase component n=1 Tax=unclassified Octadecabacter TaxID=196158 RepID=UPI001C08931C|nr:MULTISPECIES: flavin reductase [unclassified Octadecabacter]MBU2991703.1 flavin reductase [Octadecabacter sp. B2R22]MDO6735676.1 flavin reductase [Octadecabacter sp. 1_MG-2023]